MMRIGLTQRVEVVEAYGERRDCLDQNWTRLVRALGAFPVPLANLVEDVFEYVEELRLDAVILTGGNDLAAVAAPGRGAPERDAFEYRLIESCTRLEIPVLGVCRGMQVLNTYYGGRLTPVQGHVATRHEVTMVAPIPGLPAPRFQVNSFHNFGVPIDGLGRQLRAVGIANGTLVECFVHETLPQVGIMWHPERESPFAASDLELIQKLLRREAP